MFNYHSITVTQSRFVFISIWLFYILLDDQLLQNDISDQTISENKPKSKRKRRTLRATVVKNRNDLTLPEIPKVTPIEFVGNIRLDASNFENMAISKIPMDHGLYKFNLL